MAFEFELAAVSQAYRRDAGGFVCVVHESSFPDRSLVGPYVTKAVAKVKR
jgi:hypothetical protein